MSLTRTLAVGIAAALMVTAGSAVATPNTAQAESCVQTGAIFNQPHDDNGDDKIHRHIVCLVDGAAGGSEIRVATYHFAHKDIKDALLERRMHEGSNVKVLRRPRCAEQRRRRSDLPGTAGRIHSDKDEDSWIAACRAPAPPTMTTARASATRKMHNKFLLFSETHGVENVTFLTSSNLEDNDVANNSGTDMWNSGYTVAADSRLYDHFVGYFDDRRWVDGRWQDPANPDYYATVPTERRELPGLPLAPEGREHRARHPRQGRVPREHLGRHQPRPPHHRPGRHVVDQR